MIILFKVCIQNLGCMYIQMITAKIATDWRTKVRDFALCTGFSSEIGTKLRDWAVGQAGGSCYSRAAMSSNDSKTLYLWEAVWP